MRWPWQKKDSEKAEESSGGQRWTRTPRGAEAITGITAEVQQTDDEDPGEVYPDEIDPEWAERPEESSGGRSDEPSGGS